VPPLKLLFLSTPVGPLGTGLGGGVELTLKNIALALAQRGHRITVAAPTGSALPGLEATVNLIQIPGALQLTAQSQGRDSGITLPGQAVLGNLWDYARSAAQTHDLLLNFAYDWLPFYLTPFFATPIGHLVSMGSLTDAMDAVIQTVADYAPGTLGVHSQAQADTFAWKDQARVLKNGFDLSLYDFCAAPQDALAWVGRIAPEKGLEDAVAAVAQTGTTLKIWGVIQDPEYWAQIQQRYPNAPIDYQGFLPTDELQQALGQTRGLIMTPHWVEAFGNVAIEALACGVPVIAYDRGGPAEIVVSGQTGWLVTQGDVAGLAAAIGKLGQIDRAACRRRAAAEYSLGAMADRLEAWFEDILAD
jgi:UDP-glucose:tetrahydrobiopterin glucosyltransferase